MGTLSFPTSPGRAKDAHSHGLQPRGVPSTSESRRSEIAISPRINDIASTTPQNRLTNRYPRIVSQAMPKSIPPSLDSHRIPNRINDSRVRFVTLTPATNQRGLQLPAHPPKPNRINDSPVRFVTPPKTPPDPPRVHQPPQPLRPLASSMSAAPSRPRVKCDTNPMKMCFLFVAATLFAVAQPAPQIVVNGDG